MQRGLKPSKAQNGLSLLHLSANGGHVKTVEYLVEKGNMDINEKDDVRTHIYAKRQRDRR
jgi:hypothetical protein